MSLNADAQVAMAHDDAIGLPLVESEWTAMRIVFTAIAEMGQKLRKVFQLVGSDRSRERRDCRRISRTSFAIRRIWPDWRARQDSNLRPPA